MYHLGLLITLERVKRSVTRADFSRSLYLPTIMKFYPHAWWQICLVATWKMRYNLII